MVIIEDDISKKVDKENQLLTLKKMQKVSYDLEQLDKESFLELSAVKHIPLLSKFLQTARTAGSSTLSMISHLNVSQNSSISQTFSSGFQFGGVALGALDFFRIPIIYLGAFILGKKVPFTLNNNASWLYAGLLLALTITALAFPPAAPVIAFVAAAIGLGVGVTLLGKIIVERFVSYRELKHIKKDLRREEEEMGKIHEYAAHLETRLTEAKDEGTILAIYQEIAELKEKYTLQKQVILDLKNQEQKTQEKIKDLGMINILDKGVSVLLSAAGIIGLVLATLYPPVGFGVMAGVAVTGCVYIATRVAIPLIISASRWVKNKLMPTSEVSDLQENLNNNALLRDTKEQQADLMKSQENEKKQSLALDALLGSSSELTNNSKESLDSTLKTLKGLGAVEGENNYVVNRVLQNGDYEDEDNKMDTDVVLKQRKIIKPEELKEVNKDDIEKMGKDLKYP